MPDSHRLCFQQTVHLSLFRPTVSDPAAIKQSFFPYKSINTTVRSRKQSRTAQMDLHPAQFSPGLYPDKTTVAPFFSFQIFIYIRHKASIFRQSYPPVFFTSLMYMNPHFKIDLTVSRIHP